MDHAEVSEVNLKVMMVIVEELEDGLGIEVEEYQVLGLILSTRC